MFSLKICVVGKNQHFSCNTNSLSVVQVNVNTHSYYCVPYTLPITLRLYLFGYFVIYLFADFASEHLHIKHSPLFFYRVLKKSLCTWWLQYIKLQVILDEWLTVLHRSITLFDLQLDAQNSYLFTYNTFIKILYMFRALPCSSSRGLHRNCIYMQPLVLSLSAGDCLVHRLGILFIIFYVKSYFLCTCALCVHNDWQLLE